MENELPERGKKSNLLLCPRLALDLHTEGLRVFSLRILDLFPKLKEKRKKLGISRKSRTQETNQDCLVWDDDGREAIELWAAGHRRWLQPRLQPLVRNQREWVLLWNTWVSIISCIWSTFLCSYIMCDKFENQSWRKPQVPWWWLLKSFIFFSFVSNGVEKGGCFFSGSCLSFTLSLLRLGPQTLAFRFGGFAQGKHFPSI